MSLSLSLLLNHLFKCTEDRTLDMPTQNIITHLNAISGHFQEVQSKGYLSKSYNTRLHDHDLSSSFVFLVHLSDPSINECPLTKAHQPVNLATQTLPTSSLTFSLNHLGFCCPRLQPLLVSSIPCEKSYAKLHKTVARLWEEEGYAPTVLFC